MRSLLPDTFCRRSGHKQCGTLEHCVAERLAAADLVHISSRTTIHTRIGIKLARMGELSPLAYPWQSTLAHELDTSNCTGFCARAGLDADGKARFDFPNSTLEISQRVWTYHRGETEACFSTATLLGAKVRRPEQDTMFSKYRDTQQLPGISKK